MPLSFTPGQPHPESPGEQALYPLLTQMGFVANAYRVVRYVDFVHDWARVIVEIDGRTFHGETAARFELDRAQDVALHNCGYDVMRFASSQVMRDPQEVAGHVARALDRKVRAMEDRSNAEMEKWRADHAERVLAKERSGRHQLHRLTRSIGNWWKDASGEEAAAHVVRKINATLKDKYGPAESRSEANWTRAHTYLDDWWTQTRVALRISAADVPPWNAKPCEWCGRFRCVPVPCRGCGWEIDCADGGLCVVCLDAAGAGADR